MKEKRTCKIVQDLLPNYIEKLTDEETNKYIEEHINQCEECKNILENMKKGLKQNKTETNKKKVTFMKKYKNKLKILKFIILLIILILLIIFGITIGKRYLIILNISKNAEKYNNNTNYHITNYWYTEGNSILISEKFKLEDKIKTKITLKTEEKTIVQTIYGKKIEEENPELYYDKKMRYIH